MAQLTFLIYIKPVNANINGMQETKLISIVLLACFRVVQNQSHCELNDLHLGFWLFFNQLTNNENKKNNV